MNAGDLPPDLARPLVVIEGDGDLAKVCDQVEEHLIATRAPIYQRGGQLVHVVDGGEAVRGIVRDGTGPRIVALSDVALADVITRALNVRKRNRKTQELAAVDCPRIVAQTILARGQWGFPVLEAVVEHPVLMADGEVAWQSGFNFAAGLLLRLAFAEFSEPGEKPTRADAVNALGELQDLFDGFPFVDALDESVALAYLLSVPVRPVIATCPAFGVDAHAPGSGKTTLISTVAKLATGRAPAFLTLGDDPTEFKKVLFAALLEGDQQIAIDNVVGPVSGADLAVILTSPMYRGRVLGQSVNVSVPTKALITFNGNNLQIVGDLTRRVLTCRLDPGCERPAEREFAFDPVREVVSMRGHFMECALTILKAYMVSGERVKVRPFGSFEEWSRLVREPLVWLGCPDPVDSVRVLEAVDPERVQLGAMLAAVSDAFGSREFKASALIEASKARAQQGRLDGGAALKDDQVEALGEALQAVCERNGELNAKALGRWLQRFHGRIHEGLRFVSPRMDRGVALWRVEPAAAAT